MERGVWKIPNELQVEFAQNQELSQTGDWSKGIILGISIINVNMRPTNIRVHDVPEFGINVYTGETVVETQEKRVIVLPANVEGPEQEIMK